MKLTIKFYLVLILFIFLFIAAFFTKDAIQTNLLATPPPLAHLRSHIPARTSPLEHPRSPLRNPAQNTANPALKMRPRSHIPASTSL